MSLVTQVSDLATRTGTEFKTVRSEFAAVTGSLASLSTTDKSNLVAAVNEIAAGSGTGPITAADITDSTTVGRAILTAAAASNARTTLAVYSSSETDTAIATAVASLVDSAPGTLDTLKELADALGDDPAFATTVNTALGNRVRVDTAAQGLNSTQQGNARTNIGAVAASDIGDVSTDFTAIFESALQ